MNKSDFPIFKTNPKLIYLDNAATTQKPQVVIDAISKYYSNSNANIHRGIYTLSEDSSDQYEQTRKKVAEFINSKSEEIIFTSGTTDSINSLASSLSESFKPGDTIIISQFEHHSNILPWQILVEKYKLNLKYINVTSELEIDMNHFKQLLDTTEKLKLVAITGLSNVTGSLIPIEKIVTLTHSAGGQIVIDAAQLIPHIQIDIKKLDIDYLAFSAHKMYGPTGVGVLYGKKNLLEQIKPFRVGGGMVSKVGKNSFEPKKVPTKFEAGTPNIAGIIAFGTTIDYIKSIGAKKIQQYEKKLTKHARKKLSSLPNLELYYPDNIQNHSSVISFNVKNIHSHDTAQILADENIAVRAGHHCAQILTRDILNQNSTVRMSLGIYNDFDDIEKLISGIRKVLKTFSI